MINKITKNKIKYLFKKYKELSKGKKKVLYDIAIAKIPEAAYNSNAIENSALTLEDTEKILLQDIIPKGTNAKEIYEAKNLAKITDTSVLRRQWQNGAGFNKSTITQSRAAADHYLR
ncbi:MAG: hypothetical protein LBQ47_04285 [Endomicrobium sp.]|jgi:Fic family protein|nr:hypothetical protein [Endomicrobium sp.]